MNEWISEMADRTLDQLKPGESAVVLALTCTGSSRRRLMDLGILPGVRVTAELRSPLGDPVAYRVRETLIALRRVQAQEIHVVPVLAPEPAPAVAPEDGERA